jgi:hypothetical protein
MARQDHAEQRRRLAGTVVTAIAVVGFTGTFLMMAGFVALLWFEGARNMLQVDPSLPRSVLLGSLPWVAVAIALGVGTLLLPGVVFWMLRRRGLPPARAWLTALGFGHAGAVASFVLRFMLGAGF